MKLFRAACDAECDQALQRRELAITPHSVQGKWLAETIQDACAWGHWFSGVSGVPHARIIVVEVPDAMIATLFRLARLDDIGPAIFASADQLPLFTIVEVTT